MKKRVFEFLKNTSTIQVSKATGTMFQKSPAIIRLIKLVM
jgi:hypothetical protein